MLMIFFKSRDFIYKWWRHRRRFRKSSL